VACLLSLVALVFGIKGASFDDGKSNYTGSMKACVSRSGAFYGDHTFFNAASLCSGTAHDCGCVDVAPLDGCIFIDGYSNCGDALTGKRTGDASLSIVPLVVPLAVVVFNTILLCFWTHLRSSLRLRRCSIGDGAVAIPLVIVPMDSRHPSGTMNSHATGTTTSHCRSIDEESRVGEHEVYILKPKHSFEMIQVEDEMVLVLPSAVSQEISNNNGGSCGCSTGASTSCSRQPSFLSMKLWEGNAEV
jgi:hypothetical protein